MSDAFSQFDAVFNILILVTIITLAARRFKFPSTIALIFAGLLATLTARVQLPDIGSDIFLSLLLPPILFQETLHLDIDGLIDDSDTILSYAVAGTLFMTIFVALYGFLILKLSLLEAFFLGVIIAPTDPVAVLGTFNRLGVIKRFQLLVSGESLFNDGVSIVIYSILISVVTVGTLTAFDVIRITLVSLVGGILLGVISGYLVHLLYCWTDDKFAKVLISFITSFGVFRLAEGLGASGVIATVLAGLIINYRTRNFGGIGEESREMLDALWEFIGFISSIIAFIFIGVNMDPALLNRYIGSILALSVFILFTRYIMVFGIAVTIEKMSGKRIPTNWRRGIFWSGLRGAVSVVLALGITGLVPHAEDIAALTFGTVFISILIQGLTMPYILMRLNISTRRSSPKK